MYCGPRPTNILPAVVHPKKCCVNHTFQNNVVPHIHPSHTTTVNHVNFQHQHYFPHTQSVVNQVTNQQFVAGAGTAPGFGGPVGGAGFAPGFGGPVGGAGFAPGYGGPVAGAGFAPGFGGPVAGAQSGIKPRPGFYGPMC